jgi:hypothetical protein
MVIEVVPAVCKDNTVDESAVETSPAAAALIVVVMFVFLVTFCKSFILQNTIHFDPADTVIDTPGDWVNGPTLLALYPATNTTFDAIVVLLNKIPLVVLKLPTEKLPVLLTPEGRITVNAIVDYLFNSVCSFCQSKF